MDGLSNPALTDLLDLSSLNLVELYHAIPACRGQKYAIVIGVGANVLYWGIVLTNLCWWLSRVGVPSFDGAVGVGNEQDAGLRCLLLAIAHVGGNRLCLPADAKNRSLALCVLGGIDFRHEIIVVGYGDHKVANFAIPARDGHISLTWAHLLHFDVRYRICKRVLNFRLVFVEYVSSCLKLSRSLLLPKEATTSSWLLLKTT